MLIVQDQVWNRVTINRNSKKNTRYYIDEFHLLLKEEQTAAYSVEIWKRFRKWGGVPTGITQNIKDVVENLQAAPLRIERFGNLDDAMSQYQALPNHYMKSEWEDEKSWSADVIF